MQFFKSTKKILSYILLLGTIALFFLTSAMAQDNENYVLIIQDHHFRPSELIIPAGKKIKLMIDNRDTTAEEFESHDLNREKVIASKSTAIIFVGPLTPGQYKFFGEFNEKTAQGVIVVH